MKTVFPGSKKKRNYCVVSGRIRTFLDFDFMPIGRKLSLVAGVEFFLTCVVATNGGRLADRSLAVEHFLGLHRAVQKVYASYGRENNFSLAFSRQTKDLKARRKALNASYEDLVACHSELLNSLVGFGHNMAPACRIREGKIYPNHAEVWGRVIRVGE